MSEAIEVVTKCAGVVPVNECSVQAFETYLHYVREYAIEFYDYGKIDDSEALFDFTGTLVRVLDEAEIIGVKHHSALVAPMVGRRLSLMAVEEMVIENTLLYPLAFMLGDITINGTRQHGDILISIGSSVYNVGYDDLGMNYARMVKRFGNARDVIVPINFCREEDGTIDLKSLRTGNALEYYLPMVSDHSLDLAEFLARYFNQWSVSPMPFSSRDEVVSTDRYVATVIAESFRSVEVPADMVNEAFRLSKLIGDDVRISKPYRTALFVDSLVTHVAKTRRTTIILK